MPRGHLRCYNYEHSASDVGHVSYRQHRPALFITLFVLERWLKKKRHLWKTNRAKKKFYFSTSKSFFPSVGAWGLYTLGLLSCPDGILKRHILSFISTAHTWPPVTDINANIITTSLSLAPDATLNTVTMSPWLCNESICHPRTALDELCKLCWLENV